jgi:uncharacterized membrane protein
VSSTRWLLVPAVAFGATLAGTFVVFLGAAVAAYVLPPSEAGLGVGLWSIVGAALALVLSVVVGFVAGAVGRDRITEFRGAARKGLSVAGVLTGCYLLAVVIIYVVALAQGD